MLNRKSAQLPSGRIARLANAVVFGSGGVLTEDGYLISETIRGTAERGNAPIKRISGPVALLRKPGDSNYGHWLAECVPRVYEFRAAYPDLEFKFAVPKSPDWMRKLRLTSLAWAGVSQNEIIWLRNSSTLFEELFVMSGNSIHSHTHDASGISKIVEVAEKSQRKGRRLLVRRPGARRRRLVNEDEIVRIAHQNGFIDIWPEQRSLQEQVEIFSEAELIAGVTGAAMTNILWASSDCRIACLTSSSHAEFFFWDLANIRNQEFSYCFGESLNAELRAHSDFHVDPSLFERWILG
ncbi:glycosyltransferase family 61 protein [Hansschlegelia zhihuaiae]|uniref:glycosyltransferase family 61 protein n=1 Tax=Hansschlegelia zhihuaiae TaxID=405005 RepID=UPI0013E8A833|nr:glycosyltransferase 61 family protein [Hansschlegelia zhihuaiae]